MASSEGGSGEQGRTENGTPASDSDPTCDSSVEYHPAFAPHVGARIPPRRHDEPQVFRVRCDRCGDEVRVECRTGHPRRWVTKFAILHLHRDPMAHGGI